MAQAETLRKGPTLSTLRTVEEVLKAAAIPVTRYHIRKELGNSVNQTTLDEALGYLADHDLVYDEGPGGKVLWIHAAADVHAKLYG
ncbi:MAG: hypothetical protein ACYC2H_05990 [Thermoplasmatota archaeon]